MTWVVMGRSATAGVEHIPFSRLTNAGRADSGAADRVERRLGRARSRAGGFELPGDGREVVPAVDPAEQHREPHVAQRPRDVGLPRRVEIAHHGGEDRVLVSDHLGLAVADRRVGRRARRDQRGRLLGLALHAPASPARSGPSPARRRSHRCSGRCSSRSSHGAPRLELALGEQVVLRRRSSGRWCRARPGPDSRRRASAPRRSRPRPRAPAPRRARGRGVPPGWG